VRRQWRGANGSAKRARNLRREIVNIWFSCRMAQLPYHGRFSGSSGCRDCFNMERIRTRVNASARGLLSRLGAVFI